MRDYLVAYRKTCPIIGPRLGAPNLNFSCKLCIFLDPFLVCKVEVIPNGNSVNCACMENTIKRMCADLLLFYHSLKSILWSMTYFLKSLNQDTGAIMSLLGIFLLLFSFAPC